MIEKTYNLTISVKIETPAVKSPAGTMIEETPAAAEFTLKVGHNFMKHLDRNRIALALDAALTAALVEYEESNGQDFKLHPNHLKNMDAYIEFCPDLITVK